MEKVLGIGDVFFRARDPKALAAWYRDHLGVDIVPDTNFPGSRPVPRLWRPFLQDTEYLGKPEQQWMINFRVVDLDAMVVQWKTDRWNPSGTRPARLSEWALCPRPRSGRQSRRTVATGRT